MDPADAHISTTAFSGALIETDAVWIKPIGWAKWNAEEPWFPVYGWLRQVGPVANMPSPPYAVVACYESQAAFILG